MILTEVEKDSALWQKIEKHLKDRLDQRRRENDSDSLDEVKTAKQRGKIQEIKDFLALGNPKPEPEEE